MSHTNFFRYEMLPVQNFMRNQYFAFGSLCVRPSVSASSVFESTRCAKVAYWRDRVGSHALQTAHFTGCGAAHCFPTLSIHIEQPRWTLRIAPTDWRSVQSPAKVLRRPKQEIDARVPSGSGGMQHEYRGVGSGKSCIGHQRERERG